MEPVPGIEGRSGRKGRACLREWLRASPPAASTSWRTAIYFRRIRPFAEGTFWDTGEYRLILALENNQFNTSGLDEFWVGQTNLPVVGTVRVGHVKTPMGLEGDMTASSRCMTFMERSSYSEAIELNQNFVTGVWLEQQLLRPTPHVGVRRLLPDQKHPAASSSVTASRASRVASRACPSTKMKAGTCCTWASRPVGATVRPTAPTVTLATPWSYRHGPKCATTTPPAADPVSFPMPTVTEWSTRASSPPDNEYLMGLEILYIRGPFSVQAEYGWNWIDNATGVVQSSSAALTPFATPQNFMFNGGYIQLAYTLTGENRAYDKRIGTLAREYFGKPGPARKRLACPR